MRYTLHLLIALCAIVVLVAIPPSVLATDYLFRTIDYPGAGILGHFLTGINNTRQMVGVYQDPNGVAHGFVYDDSGGTFSPPAPPQTLYFDINDTGQIVGVTADSNGIHGFVLSGGTASPPIDFPNAVNTEFAGLNNAGQVVGDYQSSVSSPFQALRYSGGTFSSPLSIPGAGHSLAHDINDTGTIVGRFDDVSGHIHGFLLSSGSVTPIDVPYSTSTEAWGINNTGLVVGCYSWATGGPLAFVRDGGQITTFYIPQSDSACALKINDGGQVVGYYYDANGTHGFIATPVPPPHVSLVVECLRNPRLCYGFPHPWTLIRPGDPPPRYLPIGPIEGAERMDCKVHKGLCQELIAVMRSALVRPGAAPSAFLLTTSPVAEKAPPGRSLK